MKPIKGAGKKIETIQKDNVSISIDSLGAKVLAIAIRGENLLHYDGKNIEHSGIPICLPFFSSLENGLLIVDGENYPMGHHGFFRNSEFEMYNTGGKIVAILKSSRDTMKIWPFQFNFRATFSMLENGLKMDFLLKNEDTKAMKLAPGFHPYFAVNDRNKITLTSGAVMGNDALHDLKETPLKESGVFDVSDGKEGLKYLRVKNAPNIQLIHHQVQDTEICTGPQSMVVLSADMDLFTRMTVWRPNPDVDFICVEPSFAVNAVNRDDCIVLQSGEEFRTTLSIQKKNKKVASKKNLF
ncbi:MAG: hypothetical protein JXQ65_14705 [Candidatus Marinimicrobia bacterium]|nr:hypothetical protein [Candidatus Neomarinimicrobiota bacterium]